jgi:flavin reductase (DIM6/NTAB) family NADH-FMN oxidoreductase RutF
LFATGVTVITTRVGEHLHGMTANTLCSLSLNPLLVLICIDRAAHMHQLLEKSKSFALTILGDDQEAISRHFADTNREYGPVEFEGIKHRPGLTGAPIVLGGLGYLEGRVRAMYPGGDHTIVVAEVLAMKVERQGNPLIFYGAHYRRVAPGLGPPESRRDLERG